MRVKGSFIPTVCKELATLACWSKVSDLSLSDGTDLIIQCLLRTAPLCLLFLLVCPLGSQCSLQCWRLADQHAHLSDRSAGNSSELQQCWQGFFFKTVGVYKRRNTGVFALLWSPPQGTLLDQQRNKTPGSELLTPLWLLPG